MKNKYQFTLSILIGLLSLWGTNANAYLTTLESGNLEPVGTHRAGLMSQVRLSEGSGFNFAGVFDSSVDEQSNIRVMVGGGETNFFSSLSYKWIPIPDYKNQPALGLKLEGIYGKIKDETMVGVRLHPLVSKQFDTERGLFTPYASIPLSYLSYKSSSDTATQFVFGSEYKTEDAENFTFTTELGFNSSKAFNYIAGLVTYSFEDTRVKKKQY